MTTGYNYFLWQARQDIVMLTLGIEYDKATPEQQDLANRIVRNICGYTRSMTGH